LRAGAVAASRAEEAAGRRVQVARPAGRRRLPGMPIQTTKIEFKAKRIVFEINGGGKKGKK